MEARLDEVYGHSPRKEPQKCCSSYLCDPNKWPYRYIVLLLLCTVKASGNYIYEIPGGLQGIIIQLMGLDNTSYNLLYSVYSWPIILLAILGGFIVDRLLGLRLGLLLCVIAVNIGQLVIVLSIIFDVYWLTLVGRFVMGLGNEISFLCCDALAVLWFKGKELSFAFGIIATANRLGGSGSLFLSEPLYHLFGFVQNKLLRLGLVFLIGLILVALCLLSSAVVFVLDRRAERLLVDRYQSAKTRRFAFKDLKNFSLNFWLVVLACMIYYSSYYPLVTIGQLYYSRKYGLSINLADTANMLIYSVTITAPLFGLMINFVGFPVYWGLSGILLSIGMHAIFALSGGQFFIPFVVTPCIAITFVFFHTTIWPSIALFVGDHQLGMAFGIQKSFNNFAYSVIDIVIGVIIDKAGYFSMECFFILYQTAGVILLMILIVRIAGRETRLDMPGWKARLLEKRRIESLNEDRTVS